MLTTGELDFGLFVCLFVCGELLAIAMESVKRQLELEKRCTCRVL